MSDWGKRTLAVILAVALTLSNFPDAFFSALTGISTYTEMTAEGETEEDTGNAGTSSNDAGSVTVNEETESETEEETEVVVVEIETEEETEEEAGIMLTSTADGTTKLQTLISEAASGDTITLTNDYVEDIEISDGKNVTIDLNGHTITATGTNKVAIMVYGTLTLTDSSADGDGKVTNAGYSNIRGVDVAQAGSFTFEGGTITGFNASGNGGGILVENGASFVMSGGTVDSNSATGYGGGVFLYDLAYANQMTAGTISNNTSGLSGGGLAANLTTASTITLSSGLTISGNTAATYGGGFYFNNAISSLTISSNISGNTSTSGAGGGVYLGASISSLSIDGATIDGNTAGGAGGGVYLAVSVPAATITGSSSISGNTAAGNGGGIYLLSGSSLTLESGKINGNTISTSGKLYGGGIYLYSENSKRSTFVSTGGEVSGNTVSSDDKSDSYGGGIYIGTYASVTMSNTDISSNTGATSGGGIYVGQYAQNEITLTDLTVTYNYAKSSTTSNSGNGGGVFVDNYSVYEITISGGTYDHNTSDCQGGAIYVAKVLNLTGAVTVSGNTAYSHGGGIRCTTLNIEGGSDEDSAVKIHNNTSETGLGGGVYASSSDEYGLTATGYVLVYENTSVTNNGGGLAANSGGMYLKGNIYVYDNTAANGAGLYTHSDTAGTIKLEEGVYVFRNTTTGYGGGVYARYLLELEDGVYIYNNYATSSGGGVYARTITMKGGEIYGNSATSGGGITDFAGMVDSSTVSDRASHISGGSIHDNTARSSQGGGIYLVNSTTASSIMYIEGDVEIYNNTASNNNGGGIWAGDKLIIRGGSIHDNTALRGGGVYAHGYVGQSVEIEIESPYTGIIYDNTATYINSGNDVALYTLQSNSVYSDSSSGYTYATLELGLAEEFYDTAKGIYGEGWYDELQDSLCTADEIIYDENSSSTAYYYTFVYSTDKEEVAEVYIVSTGKYEIFDSVQAAVDAIEADSTKYGTEGSSGSEITIIMIDDSREDVTIPASVTVTLDLNGHTLKGSVGSVITVEENADLTIEDNSTSGTGQITGGNGQSYTATSWSPSSANNVCGGGLFIRGNVTLNSGTITGNTAFYGAGVFVTDTGAFTMNGGTISENGYASTYGGGVYVYKCTYKSSNDDSFIMTGGSITKNTGSRGGGVYVCRANIATSGGSITDNTASTNGGGISSESNVVSIVITGGTITGNSVTGTGTTNIGGGIYVGSTSSTLSVSDDAHVYGNTAASKMANDIYVNVNKSTSSTFYILSALTSSGGLYDSWYDYYGDGSTYAYYYTDCEMTKTVTHAYYLTAMNCPSDYVAYIPGSTGDTIYQYATEDGDGNTVYEYVTDESEIPAGTTASATSTGIAYTTLQAAVNAAGDSDVIYMLCDHTEDVTITGKTVSIDLNGYTLYTEDAYGFKLTYKNGYDTGLTIMDQSIAGTYTDVFHNPVAGAVGTLTPGDENTNAFPRAIYSTAVEAYPSTVTVDGVKITGYGSEDAASATYNSSAYYGGAIYVGAHHTVTITGYSELSGNGAYVGGALYMDGNGLSTSLTIGDDVVISGNTAYYGGGIYFTRGNASYTTYKSKLTIGAATFTGNTAYQAGAIYVTATNWAENTSTAELLVITLTGTEITGNSTTSSYAGVYMANVANVTVSGCTFSENIAGVNYGGLYITCGSIVAENGAINISDSEFVNNSAVSYAGLAVNYGVVNVSGCEFSGNTAQSYADALMFNYTSDGSKLSDTTFEGNASTGSGYIVYMFKSTATLENVQVINNTTPVSLGAVQISADGGYSSDVTIKDCTISGNSGHGIYSTLGNIASTSEVTITGNTVITDNGGYGISSSMPTSNSPYYVYRGSLILNIEDNTEIYENTSGGVYLFYSTANMTGGEIYNHTGVTYGGGVYANYANFNMSGGEIYNNTATYGGGLYLREAATSYEGGSYYTSVTADTITGGKIYGNTSTATSATTNGYGGGGIYVGDYDELVMTGGLITDNTSSLFGGGVCMSNIAAAFEMEGGQIYNNVATLGQDVYAYYTSAYANTVLQLVQASTMFTDADGKTGVGWLNESTNAVTTTAINYNYVKKVYPLTLEYETNTVVAVIWNASTSTYDPYTSVQKAVDALQTDSSDYYTTEITSPEIILVDDAVGNVEISGGQTMTINLNGYTLKGSTTAITCYGTLTIVDDEFSTSEYSAGTETGTITGTAALNGGGISIYSGGSVTMTGGQIANCSAGGTYTGTAYGGAGVYVNNGTFVLGGTASINNCSTQAYGAAVYVTGTSSTFTLQDDAVIENNSSRGGAVYLVNGKFKMTGGSIKDNSASLYGGGIYMGSGTAAISGGEISGNTAASRGGGIYLGNGTLTLSGNVSITGNSATTASSTDVLSGAGGGIYMQTGTLNIKTGVDITENSAIRGGGIYQYAGTIKMNGGEITKNTAEYGGGLVQYPTQAGVFTMTGGVLCDNISSLGNAGNDVYSVSESDYSYTDSGSYPLATLVRAADMDYTDEGYTASYNVWKDDGYSGTERTASYVGQGQYVTEKINSSTGLLLTADKYGESTATTTGTTTLLVTGLTMSKIEDGTSPWDTDTAAVTYTPVDYDGTTVSNWSNTSLQNAVAASWTAGDDANNYNGIVRTYDTVKYTCTVAAGFSGAEVATSNTVHLYVQVKVPYSSDEVGVSISGLDNAETEDYDTYQTLTGYYEIPEGAYTNTFTISLQVKGMKNGDTIEPTFTSWIEENSSNKAEPVTMEPTAVTVSATGKYNVTLLQNTQMAYTGYFDITSGEETTSDAYKEAQDNGDPSIVYGTILGYGITLSLWNDSTSKGLKGIELPEGDITFDLTMTGSLTSTSSGNTLDTAAPYVWAYKANENTETGSSLNDENRNVNMNWNDEDDTTSDTQYAYNAAPFNTRATAASSCYSGGAWSATGSQPTSTSTSTTVTFTISGYTIEPSTSTNPVQTSDGTTSSVFNNTYSKAFSAGYIQMLYPIDTTNATSEDYGYLSIYMKGIVSKLTLTEGKGGIVSADTSDSTVDDLQHFVSWYGDDYKDYAINEIVYLDNYVGNPTGLYLSDGGGETIVKYNYFNNESNGTLTSSSGSKSTPLGSIVYMGSQLSYGSDTIDATKRSDYDDQEDSAIEYNYLTAVNLLQKFDADAYTPASTSLEIVNQTYTQTSTTNNIKDDDETVIFKIVTNESATEWSTNKTTSYTLTILYAAKPDGSNWTKSDDYNSGYDSPVPEMDDYREEDLIYFTTLQDLYNYFGVDEDGEYIGHCVGILYEFRDCCIRDGRTINVTARMNVTNDFSKTGQTWCITNDVTGWTTYRPAYKKAYAKDVAAGTTSERTALSFQFSWCNVEYEDPTNTSGVTAYGAGLNTESEDLPDELTAAMTAYTNATDYGASSSCSYAKIATYGDGYVKTEYSGGWPLDHNGWDKGNCLLLYTMESSIAIKVTDIQAGGNATKTQYDLGYGERTANFMVTPSLSTSSSVSNELVTNGTQSANVEIIITLPKGLYYDEDTLKLNYGTDDSAYKEGELNWDISVVKNADGTTTITLNTTVADISKTLPTISYSTTIGTPGEDSTDVSDGDEFTTSAKINITYEEIGQISTLAKEAETTISVIKNIENYATITSSGEKELGSDIVFSLTYTNASGNATAIEIGDVLPFNGDGRGTSFTGGYRVTTITLNFDSASSLSAFLSAAGNLSANATSTTGGTLTDVIKYVTSQSFNTSQLTTSELASYLTTLMETLYNGTGLSYESYTAVSNGNTEEYYVTFTLTEAMQRLLTQLANYTSGIGLYFFLPTVGANEAVTIDITLSPMQYGTNALIVDEDGLKQTGGNIYWDNFAYSLLTASAGGAVGGYSRGTVVLGGAASRGVITRSITGIVWLDQDQDGIYSMASGSTDKPISDMEVYLYCESTPDSYVTLSNYGITSGTDNGVDYWTQDSGTTKYYKTTITLSDNSTVEVYPVVNTEGNIVASVSTGDDGQYTFEKLYAGYYYVVFKDTDGRYFVVEGTSSEQNPIEFSKLSVTERPTTGDSINKSYADYGTDEDQTYDNGGAASLSQAVITNEETSGQTTTSGIELPPSPTQNAYVSANWNLGVNYVGLNMEKQWKNILSSIEEGVAVTFTVSGENASGTEVVRDTYTLTQTASGVTVTDSSGAVVTSPTVTVVESISTDNEVTWTLSRVSLQAEGKDENKITYTITEAAVEPVTGGTQELTGFVTTVETTGNTPTSSTISVTATNTQILYQLELYKISSSSTLSSTAYLANAEFTLYTDSSCTDTYKVTELSYGGSASDVSGSEGGYSGTSDDSDYGKLTIGNLAAGTYYLKETVTPSGYELNQSVWEIVIKYEYDAQNSNWATTPVITIKQIIDKDGKDVSATATEFSLEPTATTGTTSTYYLASNATTKATLYTMSFEMENEVIYSMPSIGSVGIGWTSLGGIALMLLAVWMVLRERDKEKYN